MKTRFQPKDEVLYKGELTTVKVTQKDFSTNKIRYQLEGVSKLVPEDVLIKEQVKKVPGPTFVPEQTEEPEEGKTNEPEVDASAKDCQWLVRMYKKNVGKRPSPRWLKEPQILLEKMFETMEPEAIIDFLSLNELHDNPSGIEDLNEAIEEIALKIKE